MAGGAFDVPSFDTTLGFRSLLEIEATGARVTMELELELELMGRGNLNDSYQL